MILVTGGLGFIGSNLVKRLVKEKYEVTIIDNLSTGTMDNYVPGTRLIQEDINNINLLQGEFDICFHLAALSRVQPSFTNPSATFDSNVSGTQRVLDYCKKNNIQIIYAGSSSKHHRYTESPYATTKYLGEQLCKMYRDTYDMVIDIARFYNVYGDGEIVDDDFAAVIGIFRRQKRDGVPLTVVGDGKQTRDFTHVEDIVDGLWRIAIMNKSHEDAWELGTNKPYSINEVAMLFDHPIFHIPDQKGNYKSSQRVNSDAINILGWKPVDRLKEYVLQVS
tara:strand:- start:934 stop:1767 length:834 start_codon:yes stop_codon:yes gene_type:complete